MLDSYNDVSRDFNAWCGILEKLAWPENYDDEIWEIMRSYDECPHFGNIRQAVILRHLKDEITALWPQAQVDFYINALDSHLYIDGNVISDMEDFRRITTKYEAEKLAA